MMWPDSQAVGVDSQGHTTSSVQAGNRIRTGDIQLGKLTFSRCAELLQKAPNAESTALIDAVVARQDVAIQREYLFDDV